MLGALLLTFKAVGNTAQFTSSLIIEALSTSPLFRNGDAPTSSSCGLFVATHALHRFIEHSSVLIRGSLTYAIHDRSLRPTNRGHLPTGKLLDCVFTDVSRADSLHGATVGVAYPDQHTSHAPHQLRPQPTGRILIRTRHIATELGHEEPNCYSTKTMTWTDERVGLLQELLGGVKAT